MKIVEYCVFFHVHSLVLYISENMYVPDDDGENSDEGTGSVHDLEIRSGANQDDYLPPLLRLERYAMSDNMYNRQMVGRVALETLRAVADTPEDVRAAMDIMHRAAADTEISVRAELMEQLPHIAMVCHEEREKLHFVVEEYLLPLVIRFLGDSDNQVRKTTQAALLVLMEQGLIEMRDVEQQVCPAILTLTEVDNLVEFHTGAVALMSKMAPLLGPDATERLFMHRFAALCSLPVFYVRKVCANNFGDFCAVVGTAATEEFLLPYFVELCTDGIWGVRKACAEVFTTVSFHCTLQTRKDTLAPVFNNLLLDQSRWVRMSAFQALGQFIATFVDCSSPNMPNNAHGELGPSIRDSSRLDINLSGEVPGISRATPGEEAAAVLCSQSYHFPKEGLPIVREGNQSTVSNMACYICCVQNARLSSMENINSVSIVNTRYSAESSEKMEKTDINISSDITLGSVRNCDKNSVRDDRRDFSNRSDANTSVENENASQNFNTFQYWRVPIPDLELCNSVDEENSDVVRSRTATNDTSSSSCSQEVKSDVNAAINHELDSLASRLEQGFLIDNETLHSADAHTSNVTIHTGEQDTENVNPPSNIPDTARNHLSDENTKNEDSNTPETKDNTVSSPVNDAASVSSHEKLDMLQEKQEPSLSQQLASLEQSHMLHADLNAAAYCVAESIIRQEQKAAIMYDVHQQATSTFSQSTPSTLCSQNNPPLLYHEHKFSTTYSDPRPITYQEQKHCLSYNEGEPVSSYHEESVAPNTVVNRLIHSDVPSNRPIQDIVPHYLVDHFVSMTHPSQAQNTDNEITHHCAFSIPAVALTLGRNNWHLIKPAYEALASDVQWKVRRTVAASIHELAVILGEELAGTDLVPVFHGFIKDLDEVRIGALRHLADFLRLLRHKERRTLLLHLSDFHLTDNECNWRFRNELAEQLLHSLVLFTPADTHEHITPLSISLLMDKVAAVRKKALSLVTQLVHHVSSEPNLVRNLLAELAEQFAHNKHWNRRQTFALLCSKIMFKHVLKDEHFASDVFPHLLELSWDRVPNVRLSVAQTLACDIAVQSYFSSPESPHNEMLIQSLRRLQDDGDKDVQYFASLYKIPTSATQLEKTSVGEQSWQAPGHLSCDADQ